MSQAEVATKALGGTYRNGRGMARCPVHNDRTPSLSLADGDNGRLLVKCFGGCEPRAILAALRQQGTTSHIPVVPISQPRRPLPSDWSQRAEAIFCSSLALGGTPVEAYLLGRGCALPETDEVRYLPPRKTGQYPAMISRITDVVTSKPISLHFTFINPDGSGKAPIEKPKMLLSGHRKSGGVIRLIDDADITYGLGLTEGIETALSVMRSGWRPVWAAVDAGNLATFPVLSGIDCLTIFADHDHAGLLAAQKCANRWQAAGHTACIVPPKTEGADWND